MANFKATFIFKQNQFGWSESIYGAGAPADVTQLQANALCNLRAALSCNDVFIVALRCSTTVRPFKVVIFNNPANPGQGYQGGQAVPSVGIGMSLLTKAGSSSPRATNHYLGGLPAAVRNEDETFNVGGFGGGAPVWANWRNYMIGGFVFEQVANTPGALNNVQNVTYDANGYLRVDLTAAIGGAVGDVIVLRGVKWDIRGVPSRGYFTIKAIAGNLYTLSPAIPLRYSPTYVKGGTMWLWSPTYPAITTYNGFRFAEKKRGNSISRVRGKRPILN